MDAGFIREYDVWQSEALTLSARRRLQARSLSVAAIGGTANYASLPPGIASAMSRIGQTPYVGIGLEAVHGRSTFTGRLVGSTWAQGDDLDNHHFRSLVFSESFSSTNFVQAQLGYRYQLRPNVELTAGYQFQHWEPERGRQRLTTVLEARALSSREMRLAQMHKPTCLHWNECCVGRCCAAIEEGSAAGLSGFYLGGSASLDWRSNNWSTLSLFAPPPFGDPAWADTAENRTFILRSAARSLPWMGTKQGHLVLGHRRRRRQIQCQWLGTWNSRHRQRAISGGSNRRNRRYPRDGRKPAAQAGQVGLAASECLCNRRSGPWPGRSRSKLPGRIGKLVFVQQL